jgi:GT2 family glycosyltransferase
VHNEIKNTQATDTNVKQKSKMLFISIVTYNTDMNLLNNCLRSIRSSSVEADVLIIDNSPVCAIGEIAKHFSCDFVHLEHNPGYGSAHNVALARSLEEGYQYHLVLNADVSFSSNVLGQIVCFMNGRSEIGQLMPKVLNPDGSTQNLCKLVPTPIDLFARRFLPKIVTSRIKKRFELHDFGKESAIFIPYLSGCFMFLRCSALKSVGFFDERFFMYPEDIDLTRRIAEKYETVFYPIVNITHAYGGASYKSIRMLFIHIINIIRYFNKWGWIFDRKRQSLNNKTLKNLENIIRN